MARSNQHVIIPRALLVMLCSIAWLLVSTAQSQQLAFQSQVQPLLDLKCMGCHGGDPGRIKAGFDMRTREGLLAGGSSGNRAVLPGKPEESPLYYATTWEHPDLQMPPKEEDRLTDEQRQILHQWILEGAVWEEATTGAEDTKPKPVAVSETADGIVFSGLGGASETWETRPYQPEDLWAYQPLAKVTPPTAATNPIDAFIDTKLAETGVTPAPRADKRTLLRRVTYDLTGLPPTPEEMDAFLADDAPDAFEKVVDRLLASPRYGEQWARHWLDVVRYADTSGYANDYERPNAWRYRDYVIRSFNADKPYDQFIVEQIAGDEVDPDNPEMHIAVGYLRMGPWEHTGMSVAAVTRQLFLDDVTNSVGETFLAHGMRCASCHDHKFDPISTEDYYRLQATFAPTQFAARKTPFLPEENQAGFEEGRARVERLMQEARDALKVFQEKEDAATRAWLDERGMADLSLEAARKLPEDQRPPRDHGLSYDDLGVRKVWNKRLQLLAQERKRYEPLSFSVYDGPPRPAKESMSDMDIPKNTRGPVENTFVLLGGSIESPAQQVTPGVLRAVAPFLGDPEGHSLPKAMDKRRSALAAWIADEANPLTARVFVNRVWQAHFGRGIVGTPNNFGKMGKKPTHPELLDWLAAQFMADGWYVKQLHRRILLSEAYQRSSQHPDLAKLKSEDPENTLLAYFSPRRLRAEEIRDSMLYVSGELNLEMGGVPVWPEINIEAALQPRHIMGSVAAAYQPSPTPEQRNRRSIYAMHIRTLRNPMLEVFNQPGPDTSCERRDASTVTPQVFSLFNSQDSYNRALAMALRVENEAETPEARVDRAFQRAIGRAPLANERDECLAHLRGQTAYHEGHAPVETPLPTEVVREMVEEMTGVNFTWTERLDVYEDYVRDPQPTDVGLETRALADLCLVLLNTNEFMYVY